MNIRHASYADSTRIVEIDESMASRDNTNFIHGCVSARTCYVAEERGEVLGYSVLEHNFFRNAFITKLFVHSENRRQGVAGQMLSHLESLAQTDKIFTSTNQSNKPAEALFKKFGYESSGEIHHLDDGDPEMIFCKRLG